MKSAFNTQPSVFRPAVEGLLVSQLGSRIDPDTKAALARLGLDLDHLKPAYPTCVLDDCFEVLAARLFSELSPDQAFRELGRLQVRGFMGSPMGKAVLLFARPLSRERLLERLVSIWRQANNFIDARRAQVSPDVWELDIAHVGRHPPVIAGTLEEVMHAAGHPALIELVRTTERGACYRLTFEPR